MRVLLIDGDLRQRSLSQIFHSEAPGVDQLSQAKSVETCLKNVSFVSAGTSKSLDPTRTLTSAELAQWISQQRQAFDVVLIDTPPLSACKDTFLWAPLCDGAVIVASRQKFRGVAEGHLSEDLREQGIEILGVILTG